MRGKLQIEWDLTFNSMYEFITLFAYLQSALLILYNPSLPCFFSY